MDAEASRSERAAVSGVEAVDASPGPTGGAARGDIRDRLFRGVLKPDGDPEGDAGGVWLIQREERFLDLLVEAGLSAQDSSVDPTSRLASESTSASGAYLFANCRTPSSLPDGSKRGNESFFLPFAVWIHEDVPGTLLSSDGGVSVD